MKSVRFSIKWIVLLEEAPFLTSISGVVSGTLELQKHFSLDLQQFMLPTSGSSPLIITVISAVIVTFSFKIYSPCGTWAYRHFLNTVRRKPITDSSPLSVKSPHFHLETLLLTANIRWPINSLNFHLPIWLLSPLTLEDGCFGFFFPTNHALAFRFPWDLWGRDWEHKNIVEFLLWSIYGGVTEMTRKGHKRMSDWVKVHHLLTAGQLWQ